jgi:hypothetical protein
MRGIRENLAKELPTFYGTQRFITVLKAHRWKLPWSISVHSHRVYPFKAEWYLYVPPALPISNCAFWLYGSSVSLDVNSDYFFEQR